MRGDPLLDDETRCYRSTVADDHSRFTVMLETCSNQRHPAPKARGDKESTEQGIPALRLFRADHHRSRGSLWCKNEPRRRWALLHQTQRVAPGRGNPPGQLHGASSPGDQRQKRAVESHLAGRILAVRALRGPGGPAGAIQGLAPAPGCHPHEAIGMEVPNSRYEVSDLTYPEEFPE